MDDAISRLLGKRLAALAAMVPTGSRVADIGCDHGRLAAGLLAAGRASHCIATETDPPRLASVRARFGGLPWASRLELRAGDGLDVLDPADRIDVAVIAGLGGRAIARILGAGGIPGSGIRRIVLQPQTEAAFLRGWIVDHGLRFVDESLVVERGRFYVGLAAEPGRERLEHPSLTRNDLLAAGPILLRSGEEIVAEFWRRRLRHHEANLRDGADGEGRRRALDGAARARRILEALRPSEAERAAPRAGLSRRSHGHRPESPA